MNPKLIRFILPLAFMIIGLFLAYAMIQTQSGTRPPQPKQQQQANGPNGGAPDESQHATDGSTESVAAGNQQNSAGQEAENATPPTGDQSGAQQAESTDRNAPVVANPSSQPIAGEPGEHQAAAEPPATNYRFKPQPLQPGAFQPMGEVGDKSINPTRLILEMSERGAGVSRITLLDYYKTLDKAPDNRYTFLDRSPSDRPALAVRAVTINGQRLEATGVYDVDDATGELVFVAPVWAESDSRNANHREYTAEILDADDLVVARITRSFTLGDVEGDISIEQRITNLTDQTMSVQIEQWGPSDLPKEKSAYGDYRRFRFGYLDPRSTATVFATEGDYLAKRDSVLSRGIKNLDSTIWPNETSVQEQYTLSWAGTTNRYFAFVVHPRLADPETARDKALRTIDSVSFLFDFRDVRSLAEIRSLYDQKRFDLDTYVNLKLVSPQWSLPPNSGKSFDLGAYAGPQDRPLFAKNQPYRSLNFTQLVVYQLGCSVCTFQWLAHVLIWFLRLIEGEVLGVGIFDWGLAIIILVLVVRGILHPLTKKGQVSMQRMQKKMSAIQPEIKKLQEKYKDNPQKLQQEQMKLYKEHNVHFGGCLGMAPMFLQMPIWVALYAVLYFAIELRHEPAFYGVFQLVNHWSFLADLSQPDKFIDFGGPINALKDIPLLKSVSSINLLPILMGAIFFLQQKYMTPQNPNLSPEQETQQKIMKIIFPLLFPVMLYNAPAGLTLYILTSSCIGIVESRYIRAHVSQLDLENGARKPAGPIRRWFEKQQARVQMAQRAMDQRQKGQSRGNGRNKGKGGRKSPHDRKPR